MLKTSICFHDMTCVKVKLMVALEYLYQPNHLSTLGNTLLSGHSPHWLYSWPGSRCCSFWPVTVEDSRNRRSSCCLPPWMAEQLWGWMEAALQRCSRVSPRWRHCGSWQGRRNTQGLRRWRGGSWTCGPPSQQADRSWKHEWSWINVCFCVLFTHHAGFKVFYQMNMRRKHVQLWLDKTITHFNLGDKFNFLLSVNLAFWFGQGWSL